MTNTNTSGAGSLAKAITDANLTVDPDTINFNITSAMPVLTIGGTLLGIAIALYAGVQVPLRAEHAARNDPVAIGVSVSMWTAMALLYPSLRRGSASRPLVPRRPAALNLGTVGRRRCQMLERGFANLARGDRPSL